MHWRVPRRPAGTPGRTGRHRRLAPGTAGRAGRPRRAYGTARGEKPRRARPRRPPGAAPCPPARRRARTALSSGRRRRPAAPGSSGLDNDELAGPVVQPDAAVLAADHDVLDPGAVPARVDPWLDGERHPGLKRLRVASHDVGVFVALQADAVAGPVDEMLAVAGRGDRLARGGIHR